MFFNSFLYDDNIVCSCFVLHDSEVCRCLTMDVKTFTSLLLTEHAAVVDSPITVHNKTKLTVLAATCAVCQSLDWTVILDIRLHSFIFRSPFFQVLCHLNLNTSVTQDT